MNTARRQGLKMLLLTACIVSANFVTTRPSQGSSAKPHAVQQLLTTR